MVMVEAPDETYERERVDQGRPLIRSIRIDSSDRFGTRAAMRLDYSWVGTMPGLIRPGITDG